MERLTVRDNNGKAHMSCKQMCGDYGNRCDDQIDVDMCQRYVAFNKLAEYEDLEEQGLLLRLPCKVGDSIYSVIEDGLTIVELKFSLDFYVRRKNDIGKTVFISQEQAEEKLKEIGGSNDS